MGFTVSRRRFSQEYGNLKRRLSSKIAQERALEARQSTPSAPLCPKCDTILNELPPSRALTGHLSGKRFSCAACRDKFLQFLGELHRL